MLYQNADTQRRLIAVNREKRWIQPNEIVELSNVDVRTMGANGAYMRKYTPSESVVAETASPKRKKETGIVAKVKAAIKKKEEPTKEDLKAHRAELKEALEAMNKGEMYAFGEDNLDIDLKFSDKKATLVKNILKAAKEVGYKKILRKI